jgi:osmoprotectant transport system permease protein
MDVAWIVDHLDDLLERTIQHIYLTAIPVIAGFLISFVLAILAVRRRGTRGPILAVSGILYTVPSLAMFAALVSITGLSTLTAVIPLTIYTLLIFIRNIVAGFDSVPADVLEAADGMGYTRGRRLRDVEIPLAVPLVVAGLRLATVSTIGLVTISAILGDRFGGLGYFILEGGDRRFPTEIYFGAIPSIALAIAADVLFVRLQRRITPWTTPATAVDPSVPATSLEPA